MVECFCVFDLFGDCFYIVYVGEIVGEVYDCEIVFVVYDVVDEVVVDFEKVDVEVV